MSKSEDINTLFRRFGGNADTYQEVVASELVGVAAQRWPILGELRPQGRREAPAALKGARAVGDRQVQNFMSPQQEAVEPPVQARTTLVREAPVEAPRLVEVPVGVGTPARRRPKPVALAVAVAPVPVEVPASPSSVPVKSMVRPSVGAAGRASALFGRALSPSPVRGESLIPPPPPPPPQQEPARPVSRRRVALAVPSTPLQQAAQPVPAVVPPSEVAANAGEGSDLHALFNRLVPPKPETSAERPIGSLKRLVKW